MKLWPEGKNFHPKKSLGQNFLVDENIARKIVRLVNPQPGETFVEIGPGSGILTRHLLPKVKHLIAVEIDSRLVSFLKETFAENKNFSLIAGDFLRLNLRELLRGVKHARILGNIPYNITSPVIFKVLEHRDLFIDMTLMIQKEVAVRVVASPGNKDYGILSVYCQLFAEPRILFHVSRHVFKPEPEVDSSVVRWKFYQEPKFRIENQQIFDLVVHRAFQMRRKMLKSSLRKIKPVAQYLKKIDFDLNRRPEELSPEQWVQLSNLISKVIPGGKIIQNG
ncbi:MAG: ribosomal RNA small subunit methyltransferase A [Calditrichaeota bacterium]|nr:MAG: ribosomal RNA small subunit methyltransferase A [Calditrichota bacterium]